MAKIIDAERALALLREEAEHVADPGRSAGRVLSGERCAFLFQALDRHIAAGGPLPADWRPDRRAPASPVTEDDEPGGSR
jgi:hypothetical protein